MPNKKYLDLGGVSRLVTNINSKYLSRDNIGSEVAAISHEHTGTRSSGTALTHNLSDLVGIYVNIVGI